MGRLSVESSHTVYVCAMPVHSLLVCTYLCVSVCMFCLYVHVLIDLL